MTEQATIVAQHDPILLAFWAKFGTGESGMYHPLLCHSLDVGMAAAALFDEALPSAQRLRFARTFGLDLDAAARWIPFLAATHDLGKLAPAFQCKVDAPALRSLVAATGLPFHCPKDPEPHGKITAATLPAILQRRFGLATAIGGPIAVAVGGHHGIFPTQLRQLGASHRGDAAWDAHREALVVALAEAFGIRPGDPVPTAADAAGLVAFAGFVSVADWIGSNQEHFPPLADAMAGVPSLDVAAYAAEARRKAGQALEALGWTRHPASAPSQAFDALFGFPPNDLQRAALEAATALAGPGLAIVEAPMGEGKTEAALAFADAQGALGARGIYVALPTQATSNQLFARLRDFLKARYPGEEAQLLLLHGHADFNAEFQWLQAQGDKPLPRPEGLFEEEPEAAALFAAAWFTNRKRGLLAPFGVGTIDQALLAALRVRHGFVRLFGLAGKTVIIDEVHAYDTYMSGLLVRLLAWLGALGAPVVLLSATLPSARRRALLAAYAEGAGFQAPVAPAPAYPRLTWVGAAGEGGRGLATSSRNARSVTIRAFTPRWPGDQQAEDGPFVDAIAELGADGGCILVLCNTISRAQAVYEALAARFPGAASDDGPRVDLFHARYPFAERDLRERRCLARFGKPRPDGPARPRHAILVATQVVEQSLDLDFDAIVTEFAPVDLLLQRMGRLHRHVRPERLGAPTLHVAEPLLDQEGVPHFGAGTEAVYAPHLLLRTWLALAGVHEIQVPQGIEPLVERVYAEEASPPPGLAPPLAACWERTRVQLDRVRDTEQNASFSQIIRPPEPELNLGRLTESPGAEDRPDLPVGLRAVTRLARPSVSIVCLEIGPDGTAVLPGGGGASLARRPSHAEAKALLLRSVSISRPGVVKAIEAIEVPPGWARSPWLKDHRPVAFGPDGRAPLPGSRHALVLDPALGIDFASEERP